MARKLALQPIERAASLGERVYQMLREHLYSGRVRTGQPLPELGLEAELGVSRTPVREALVDVEGRSFVAPSLTGGDLQDIYELRVLLETAAARQVARRTDIEADLARVRDALAFAAKADERGSAADFIAANRKFRAAWLALVPNRGLERAVELYAAHVRALQVLTLGEPQPQKEVLRGMRDILRAIEKRDPEEAAGSMRRYLDIARAAMQQAAGRITSQAKVA